MVSRFFYLKVTAPNDSSCADTRATAHCFGEVVV